MRSALTGTRIRERRLNLGLRQADVARAAGVSAAYLNLIEHNRRRVAPALLAALADVLGVEARALAEGAGGALLDGLRQAAAESQPAAAAAEIDRIEEFVGRFPGWAGLLAARQDQVAKLTRTVETLAERMSQDPFLAASLHEVLSAVTAVRSAAAILAETEDIDPEWRARFHRNIHADSLRLTNAASALVAWLDQAAAPEAGLASPQEEFEAWLEDRAWQGAAGAGPEGIEAAIREAPELASEASRTLARAHVAERAAAALRLPDAPLAEALARHGPDPAALALALDRPVPLVLDRLGGLPSAAAGADGPAFPDGAGYAACDASGTLTFRRAAPGFPFPRFGDACALWPLFEALSQPGVPVRRTLQVAGRGAGARFAAFAWAERSFPADYDAPPVIRARMLVVPLAAAAPAAPRGRAAGAERPPLTVGASCRICAAPACPARREPSILA